MKYTYPSGIIFIFDDSCPTGWTRVSAFDGSFLRGSSVYGGTGGGVGHTHEFNQSGKFTNRATMGSSFWASDSATDMVTVYNHSHPYNRGSSTSDSTFSEPPYIEVVFCKKD